MRARQEEKSGFEDDMGICGKIDDDDRYEMIRVVRYKVLIYVLASVLETACEGRMVLR